MNLQPIYPLPRRGFADNLVCVRCGQRGAMVADLDGTPFQAYYHQVCVPPEHLDVVRAALVRAVERAR